MKYNTWYNTSEPWKLAKWNKPVTKDHTLYNSIYIKCLREKKSIETESQLGLPRVRGGKQMGSEYGCGVSFWGGNSMFQD